MERRKNFKLRSWALAFLLPAFFVSCTKSGALTGATSPSTLSGNLTGSVNGGLSPVVGATVSVFVTGNNTPLASATTSTNGSFTIAYNNPGSGLLYVMASGGNAGSSGTNGKIQMGALLGLASNAPASAAINELTTVAFMNMANLYGIVKDTGGAVTFSVPNQAGLNNAAAQYDNFVSNGGVNPALSSTSQTALLAMGNAAASCVENSANCNQLFNQAISSSGGSAANLLDAIYNALNVSTDLTPIYNLAVPLTSATGYNIPSSVPSGLSTFIVAPVLQSNTFSVGGTPRGIAIDRSGNLWVDNFTDHTVSKLSASGNILGTFSVTSDPNSLAIDASGNVWVSSYVGGGGSVTELNSSGAVVGTFLPGASTADFAVAIDAGGNVWVTNYSANTVTELNASGTTLGTFTTGTNPYGVAIDSNGNVWIANDGSNNVTRLNASGSNIGAFTAGSFPFGIGIDRTGNAWVVNTGGGNVTKLSPTGAAAGTFTTGGSFSVNIAFDALGNPWISNQTSDNIIELNASGTLIGKFNCAQAYGLAIDALGNVWVTNTGANSAVTEFIGATTGPQFFPYSGPVVPFSL